jgi:alpha-tubulin suppressor-like RCC1 family protein
MLTKLRKRASTAKRTPYSRCLSILLASAIVIGAASPSAADQYIFRGNAVILKAAAGTPPEVPVEPPPPTQTRTKLSLVAPADISMRRYQSVAPGTVAVAANALASVTYSVTPALPQGLSLNSDGSITGQALITSPETVYTISATDGIGGELGKASASFKLAIDNRVPLAVSGVTEVAFERLSDTNSVRFAPDAAATVYGNPVWNVIGPVPQWLKFDRVGNELILSGKPTDLDPVGVNVQFTLADNYNVSNAHTVRLTVVRPSNAKIELPNSITDNVTFLSTYYQDIAAQTTFTGLTPNEVTWTTELEQPGDALIPGIVFEGDGTLSGQPLSAGTFSFSIKATAGENVSATKRYSITVHPEVASRVSATDNSTCLQTAEGAVKCWGRNTYSQLGDGTTNNSSVPVAASRLSGKFKNIAGAYAGSMCALKEDGTVWCWGLGTSGQLGNGASVNSSDAVQVSGLTNVTTISGGYNHFCAIKTDGSMWCWGSGYGIGNGVATNRNVPVQVPGMGSGVISMATGNGFSCASKNDGSAWCWGSNGNGRLGDGTNSQRLNPVPVSGLRDVIAMTGGYDHACATKYDKTVVCWGSAQSGQLGNNVTTGDFFTPQTVIGLTDTYYLTTGDHHSCAIKTDRTVVCWGSNSQGQLGDGTNTSRSAPMPVPGMNNVSSITTIGYQHTCASKSDGSVWCWGANGSGQLGNNTTTGSKSPVRVSGT